MESLIKNVKQGQGYMVSTYIGNAMTYSFSIDKDFLMLCLKILLLRALLSNFVQFTGCYSRKMRTN